MRFNCTLTDNIILLRMMIMDVIQKTSTLWPATLPIVTSAPYVSLLLKMPTRPVAVGKFSAKTA